MKRLCSRGSLGRVFKHVRAKFTKVCQLIGRRSDSELPRVPSAPAPASVPAMTRTPAASISGKKQCQLCLETADALDFPFSCANCQNGSYCAPCLRGWFIDACKNESKMPPRCCSIIPIKSVSGLLTSLEIEHFKAKLEERSTSNRLYCPIPTCSTFIHPRLYVEKAQAVLQTEWTSPRRRPLEPDGDTPMPDAPCPNEKALGPVKTNKPHVSCPKCSISVCTNCHALTHIGECPTSDLDLALEEQLKKWKIKRCPKCRTGIRKVYGCADVQCICGAHFCWECLLPLSRCGGECKGNDSNYESGSDVEEDDLDGRAGFFDGDGLEFGPEPHEDHVDAWGCWHMWRLTIPQDESLFRSLECHECFRPLEISPDQKGANQNTGESIGPLLPSPVHIQRNTWTCFSGHVKCNQCPKLAPRSSPRYADVTRLWECDCGIITCSQCDREQGQAKWAEERAFRQKEIWQCSRCSIIVCGLCK